MIESAAQVDDGIAVLDRASEEQWQRLRRQVEWASAFWLGFVFCQSPQIAATFRARIEHLLRYRARSVHVLVPPSPNELGSLLQVLFEPAMTAKGLVWVEAIRADPLRSCADQPGPWTAAWDQLLLLLNERRDALSRHLQGGLMMVAPVAVKPRARVAAPDVWSIRSVVIEVPARVERSAADSGDEIEATDGLRSPAGEPVSPARMQFREIDAFLARGETAQATALARKAVATQRARSARLCAEALEWLCRSRTAEGTSRRHWSM